MPTLNFQSIELSETTEDFNQSVCENVNTNLEQLERDVQELRDWLNSQPHLPQCSSDTMLKTYILASKNKMERAKEKIENYYITRAKMPDIFSERDTTSEKITESGELIHIYTLPKHTPDGCRISIISFTTGEAKKFNTTAFSKRILMNEDIKINREAFNKGLYFVFDGKYFSMGHAMKITPRFVWQMMFCTQDVLPLSIKGIIFINSPSYLGILINIMKSFTKSKLLKKIHIHTKGPEVLEKYFPIVLLPKDYGGEEDTSDKLNESWLKCLRENREWFLNEGQLKADLDKNKVTPEKNRELKETNDSLRNLCID